MTDPDCYHQKKNIVWTRVGNDCEPLTIRQLRHQCADCGRLLPQALQHSLSRPNTPDVDMNALRAWNQHFVDQWATYKSHRSQLFQKRNDEWRAKYNQHLMSEKWMLIREKVFARSKGVCEGCRERRPTAVHHLTYDHMGDELLWELVAVCRECHERAHDLR